MEIVGLDHVQIAMPPGGEEVARRFYGDLLGLPEVEKPAALRARGGCWFGNGRVQLHLGIEANFVPATKAHPAFLVNDLAGLAATLTAAGFNFKLDEMVPERQRGHLFDPFGNRIELMQDGDGFQQREE
ncbi:MAG TPA: glyoxalase [Chloroflexota bacterium]|nr:glyoxalase [Chloroflexota bacterium]